MTERIFHTTGHCTDCGGDVEVWYRDEQAYAITRVEDMESWNSYVVEDDADLEHSIVIGDDLTIVCRGTTGPDDHCYAKVHFDVSETSPHWREVKPEDADAISWMETV